MRIERPSVNEQHRVLRSIVDEALAPYVDSMPTVTSEAFRRLSECSPRLAKRIVALAYAVADDRLDVSAADIEAARRVVGRGPARRAIGFQAF